VPVSSRHHRRQSGDNLFDCYRGMKCNKDMIIVGTEHVI
jgi:hypothetical protein